MRLTYKHATFGLAAAMVIVTFPQWSAPDFMPGDDRPAATDMPEWWDTHHDEQENKTVREYNAMFDDCTLRLERDLGESKEVSERVTMDCAEAWNYGEGYYKGEPVSPEMVPPSFDAAWAELRQCSTFVHHRSSPEYDWHDAYATVSVFMYCNT
ncbi:MAG: hypothetical protein OXK17_10015 [Thaumarchaeota archaeon]|nr:hypothetical protein [Nitrososphaerota archaeon]